MTGFSPPVTPSPDELLDIALGEILELNSPYAYSTLTAVERFLHQFQLQSQFEAYEILARAYLVGKRQVRQGMVITNPHAWLKRTAFSIIRQEHQGRVQGALSEPLALSCRGEATPDVEQHLTTLWQALITLAQEEPSTIRLLAWRMLDGLSWQAIQHRLTNLGERAPSDLVLRQRAMRAKKYLRRVFHACQAGRR